MGTIVVGKIESGKVSKGQSVIIMPNKVLNIFKDISNYIFHCLYSFIKNSVSSKYLQFIMSSKMKYPPVIVAITFGYDLRVLKKRFVVLTNCDISITLIII
jgi:hypothetical protein